MPVVTLNPTASLLDIPKRALAAGPTAAPVPASQVAAIADRYETQLQAVMARMASFLRGDMSVWPGAGTATFGTFKCDAIGRQLNADCDPANIWVSIHLPDDGMPPVASLPEDVAKALRREGMTVRGERDPGVESAVAPSMRMRFAMRAPDLAAAIDAEMRRRR